MLTATIVACGLWGISWYFGKSLSSAWGVLLPCALMPLLAMQEPTLPHLKVTLALAMLAATGMLYHRRLRHYVLLPSCVALVSGLTVLSTVINGG